MGYGLTTRRVVGLGRGGIIVISMMKFRTSTGEVAADAGVEFDLSKVPNNAFGMKPADAQLRSDSS